MIALTLETIPTTLQEIFDRGTLGVIEQGGAALGDDGGSCVYRADRLNPAARRCIVGHCIPDEAYSPEMEERSLSSITHFPGLEVWADEKLERQLDELQMIHDGIQADSDLPAFKQKCRAFADEYGLVVPEHLKEAP